MSLENPFFSYTNRDFENSRKEGMARIPILSKGLWTDLNAGDPGVVLLDYMHALADLCNYYLDHQALESILSTAKERINLLRHAASVSYKVRSPKGALVDVKFYITESIEPPLPITVPAGTVLETYRGITYRTLQDTVITELQEAFYCPCEQGTSVTETYHGTGTSSRTPQSSEEMIFYENQSYKLKGTGADADTISVVDSSGTIWKQVDFIAFEETATKSYQVLVDENHRVSIKFGDGVRGYSPKPSDVLTIRYIDTKGSNGAIKEGELSGTISVKGSDGTYYTVNYRNDEASVGGSYQESTEDLRRNIITSIKTNDRAVTREDFERLTATIDGVKQVKVYDIHTAPDYCLYHEVHVIVMPDTAKVDDSKSLIQRVSDSLRDKSIPPTNVLVSLPRVHRVPLEIKITRKKYIPAGEDNVYDNVIDAIDKYFDSLGIGESYNPFDLSAAIKDVIGVSAVSSISPSTPVDPLPMERIYRGDLSLNIV